MIFPSIPMTQLQRTMACDMLEEEGYEDLANEMREAQVFFKSHVYLGRGAQSGKLCIEKVVYAAWQLVIYQDYATAESFLSAVVFCVPKVRAKHNLMRIWANVLVDILCPNYQYRLDEWYH